MRKLFIALAVVAIVAAIAIPAFKPAGAKILQVNEVGADPMAYSGTIIIAGVMAATSAQDPTIFGVMDLKELQCTLVDCKKLLIPVQFKGKPPVMGDEVRITGAFAQVDGGLVFAAQNVEVVRNHKIGG